MQKYIIPVGGVLVGSGIMTMLFGWQVGESGKDSAEQIGTLGFNALGEISMTGVGPIAFALILAGIALLIYGNATAWRQTGGY